MNGMIPAKFGFFALLFLITIMGALAEEISFTAEDTLELTYTNIFHQGSEDVFTITNNGAEEIQVVIGDRTSYVGSLEPAGLILSKDATSFNLSDSRNVTFTLSGSNDVEAGVHTWTIPINVSNSTSSLEHEVTLTLEVTTPNVGIGLPLEILFQPSTEQNNVSRSITVSNTGDSTLTNLTFSTTLASSFNAQVTPASISSLAPGNSVSVTLAINIPTGQDSMKSRVGDFVVSSNQVSSSTPIFVQREGKLAIKELDIRVGGSRSRDVQNGDTISDEARPGDEITIKFDIENLFTSDEDIDIENIEVEILILDVDSGDDIELEVEEFDLRAERSESVDFSFVVPYLIDEDTYTIEIRAEGEDEDGFFHEVSWEVFFEVEKRSREIIIERVALSPTIISCGTRANVDVSIVNAGRDDEDLRVVVESRTLDFFGERDVELEEGSGNRARQTVSIDIPISQDSERGIHTVLVDVYRGASREVSEVLQLELTRCVSESAPVQEEEDFAVQPTTPGVSVPVQVQRSGIEGFRNSDSYLIALGVLVLILALIVFGLMFRK